ncbi:hypothetical protein PFLmoz3_05041 [Pseudomonas fluorescens]|uniref:Uncharacterized protein n=1 Tax=Pseudomonas fluorescens TaxID=294 RepID=A0A125QHR5_PSEFL|nr:hypothetical protein PFLmoz3_05041 [Pseudomonas fluorescens]
MHDPQRNTAELVAELAHTTGQRLLAVGFDVGRHHHCGVGTDGSLERAGGVLDEALDGRISYVGADDLGELIYGSTATLERLFCGLVRAVFPRSLDAYSFAGANFLGSDLAVGVDIAMLQAAAELVESTLAEVALDQFVIENDCAVGRGVEHIQVVLDALQVCSLRLIVVDDQVAVDSCSHGSFPLLGQCEICGLAVLALKVALLLGGHFGAL